MAPEAITDDDPSDGSDWWSLGIIFYEMIFGKLPYPDNSLQETYEKILKTEIKIREEECSKDAKDLLEKLLTKNLKERLGYVDAGDIMIHPFFQSISWGEIGKIMTPKNEDSQKSIMETGYVSDHFKVSDLSQDGSAPSAIDNSSKYGSLEIQIEGFSYCGDEMLDESPKQDKIMQ
eukprot:CAMPEP_0205828556 /NCGR_PEP_ID=MMETSP0206-20130828/35517_1 /ASSEMBLY_ACC=CAM_ASM_000279 /TAXON_ID=36767 /ORGANISM="Euplotes focardii, Strain TN1" /LENGTH=175 /DNA_ID=CAMNT_0053130515 /DNA_START=341 /DNA_END=868 /DNA_ORIENTATION=-